MNKQYIYLVVGSTGEYDDYRTWTVKAFKNKEKAEEFKKACQDISDNYSKQSYFDLINPESELDSNFTMDYNGVEYYVETVSFE
jgi:hypothetical protein